MRKIYGFLIVIAALCMQGCGSDDGGGFTDEQRQLVMGQSTGSSLFFTDLANPLVLARDMVHSNVREFDLNNDGVIDITLRAYEEFSGNKGLTLSTMSDSARVSLNSDMIKPLEEGDIVTITSETWGFADQAPLAVSEAGNTSGTWNMLGRRYIAARLDIGNSRFLAWIEISVENYDNYSFYNYVLRAVP